MWFINTFISGIGLVILIHIVEGQAHELAIHHCLRVIKGITISTDGSIKNR